MVNHLAAAGWGGGVIAIDSESYSLVFRETQIDATFHNAGNGMISDSSETLVLRFQMQFSIHTSLAADSLREPTLLLLRTCSSPRITTQCHPIRRWGLFEMVSHIAAAG